MPSLPRAERPKWQPAPAKRPYQQHAARSADYGTARWQRARLAHLQANPCCATCARYGRTTAATIVDHIQPVRLGGAMWDAGNYQSLCVRCHARKSRQERDMKA